MFTKPFNNYTDRAPLAEDEEADRAPLAEDEENLYNDLLRLSACSMVESIACQLDPESPSGSPCSQVAVEDSPRSPVLLGARLSYAAVEQHKPGHGLNKDSDQQMSVSRHDVKTPMTCQGALLGAMSAEQEAPVRQLYLEMVRELEKLDRDAARDKKEEMLQKLGKALIEQLVKGGSAKAFLQGDPKDVFVATDRQIVRVKAHDVMSIGRLGVNDLMLGSKKDRTSSRIHLWLFNFPGKVIIVETWSKFGTKACRRIAGEGMPVSKPGDRRVLLLSHDKTIPMTTSKKHIFVLGAKLCTRCNQKVEKMAMFREIVSNKKLVSSPDSFHCLACGDSLDQDNGYESRNRTCEHETNLLTINEAIEQIQTLIPNCSDEDCRTALEAARFHLPEAAERVRSEREEREKLIQMAAQIQELLGLPEECCIKALEANNFDLQAAMDSLMAVEQKKCPTGHALNDFSTPHAGFYCDSCNKPFPAGTTLWGCRTCDYDLCEDCKKLPQADASPSEGFKSRLRESTQPLISPP